METGWGRNFFQGDPLHLLTGDLRGREDGHTGKRCEREGEKREQSKGSIGLRDRWDGHMMGGGSHDGWGIT